MLRKTVNLVTSSSMIRKIAVVATGAAVGQFVSVAFSPILTRIFGPAAFGEFATFSSIIGPLCVICCLKLENAIVVESTDEEAIASATTAVLASLSIASLASVAIWIIALAKPSFFGSALNAYLVPVTFALILLSGLGLVGQSLSVRSSLFSAVSVYQAARSALTVFSQAILGIVAPSGLSLLTGQILGQALSSSTFSQNFRTLARRACDYNKIAMLQTFRRNSSFVYFGTLQSLANAFSATVPLLIIGVLFGKQEVGLFWLAFRMLALPAQILAESMRVVLAKSFADLSNRGVSMVLPYYKATGVLIGACVPIAVVVCTVAPLVFSLAFGAAWEKAGYYAIAIMPSWIVSIAAVPSAVVVSVKRMQGSFLIYEVTSLVLKATTLILMSRFVGSIATVGCYAIVTALVQALWAVYVGRKLAEK